MIVDVLDLDFVAGPNRSPRYVESTYRGMHVELLYDAADQWAWSFYDSASQDPELAVARGSQQLYVAAEKELIDYIDGYTAR